MSGIPYESFAIKRHAFQARVLDAMGDADFADEMWALIQVREGERWTARKAVERAAYAAKPWYKRLFSVKPL